MLGAVVIVGDHRRVAVNTKQYQGVDRVLCEKHQPVKESVPKGPFVEPFTNKRASRYDRASLEAYDFRDSQASPALRLTFIIRIDLIHPPQPSSQYPASVQHGRIRGVETPLIFIRLPDGSVLVIRDDGTQLIVKPEGSVVLVQAEVQI